MTAGMLWVPHLVWYGWSRMQAREWWEMRLETEAGCHARKFSCRRRAHWREERTKGRKPQRRLTARFQVKQEKAPKGRAERDLGVGWNLRDLLTSRE